MAIDPSVLWGQVDVAFTLFFFFFLNHAVWHVEFPKQGLHSCTLHWKLGFLTTEPPGEVPGVYSLICLCIQGLGTDNPLLLKICK